GHIFCTQRRQLNLDGILGSTWGGLSWWGKPPRTWLTTFCPQNHPRKNELFVRFRSVADVTAALVRWYRHPASLFLSQCFSLTVGGWGSSSTVTGQPL